MIRHTFTPKRIAVLASAAAVLLGVVITAVLLSGPDDDRTIVEAPGNTSDPAAPGPVEPAQANIVATLTAEREAAWSTNSAEGASAPGAQLRAGQTLTLTQGFAEITTARGAVAVIEAPTTIEFTNNDNAIELRSGKLIGVCENKSSKGFLVRTPHMDVTDLGTRFGITVDTSNGSVVQVFEGSVAVTQPDRSSAPRLLQDDASFALDATGEQAAAPQDTAAFSNLAGYQSGILSKSDSVVIVPSRPSVLNSTQYISNSQVHVFEELRGVELPSDVALSITEPGRYDRFLPENFGTRTIEAGTVVRSFVIRAKSDGRMQEYLGELTFGGEILGVMSLKTDWYAFVEQMPEQAIDLDRNNPSDRVQDLLEGADSPYLGGELATDWLRIDPDRRTLTFRFFVATATDHIRVFVAVPAEAARPSQP
ncbi:MAG: FecR domain-containing protein [Planctomycetota bacterium]